MEKRHFTFKVEGQYYAAHGSTGLPVIKQYEGEFKLLSMEGALSIIVKYLLNAFLTNKYPDYARFRTHKITSMQTHGAPPQTNVLHLSFDEMTAQQLTDFCILKQIFIDPSKHANLEKCRNEVARIYQNRLDQKKQDEKTGKAAEQKEIDTLMELNKIPKLEGSIPNLNMQRTGTALKNISDGKAIEKVGYEALESMQSSTVEGTGALMEEVPVDNDPALTAAAFGVSSKAKIKPKTDDLFE